jgi:hypothetical protein
MLDSLQKLGKHLEKDLDFFDSLIKYPTKGRKGKEQYLVRVIFDLDEKRVIADPIIYQQELAKEYLWVGNTFSGSREKVARLTTNNLRKYLMVESTDSGEADKTQWKFVENNLIINTLTLIDKFRQKGLSTPKIDKLGEILSELKETFIKNGGTVVFENELHVNPVENTFYLLSGYAFNTYIHLSRGGFGD